MLKRFESSKCIIVDLFYLPPVEFFVAINGFEILMIEKQDNYQKQDYRNRAAIRLANKVQYLSVPVKGGNKKIKYSEIQIDNKQNWINVHLRGIQSAYGNAPFFEYIYPSLEKVYKGKFDKLYDLNMALLTTCLNFLKIKIQLQETENYSGFYPLYDLRRTITSKESFQGRNIFSPMPYTQIFGLDFVPNLSIIDLLFCEGNLSNQIIEGSKKRI